MARKPSMRSKSLQKAVDLNLVPYLDIVINIIMFMLFTSTGLLQIGIINVNAPRYQDPLLAGMSDEQPPEEKQQLNLTVGITYQGFFIAGVGGVLQSAETAAEEVKKGPTIPLLETDQACRDAAVGNFPPPPSCYNYPRLTQELIKVKDVFPHETKVFIFAKPEIPYETLVKVMDASRQQGDRALFYDVILSPEID